MRKLRMSEEPKSVRGKLSCKEKKLPPHLQEKAVDLILKAEDEAHPPKEHKKNARQSKSDQHAAGMKKKRDARKKAAYGKPGSGVEDADSDGSGSGVGAPDTGAPADRDDDLGGMEEVVVTEVADELSVLGLSEAVRTWLDRMGIRCLSDLTDMTEQSEDEQRCCQFVGEHAAAAKDALERRKLALAREGETAQPILGEE